MGKPKARRKAANAAKKRQNTMVDIAAAKDDDTATIISTAQTKPWDVRSEVFHDIEVGSAIIKERLPDFDDVDTRTVITSKSFKGLNVRKKDKRKIKHELWNQKVGLIKAAKESNKAKKKRQKTVITGDMLPLEQSLPSLEKFLDSHSKSNDPKSRSVPKEKTRRKEQLSDIDIFKQVLKHPEYQKNPSGTISTHLTNKMKLEQKTDMDTM